MPNAVNRSDGVMLVSASISSRQFSSHRQRPLDTIHKNMSSTKLKLNIIEINAQTTGFRTDVSRRIIVTITDP